MLAVCRSPSQWGLLKKKNIIIIVLKQSNSQNEILTWKCFILFLKISQWICYSLLFAHFFVSSHLSLQYKRQKRYKRRLLVAYFFFLFLHGTICAVKVVSWWKRIKHNLHRKISCCTGLMLTFPSIPSVRTPYMSLRLLRARQLTVTRVSFFKETFVKFLQDFFPLVITSFVDPFLSQLLIGFENGVLALWDLVNKVADYRYNCNQPVHSIAWHYEGKQFVCSHSDGTLTIWNMRSPANPANIISPHGKLYLR